MARQRGNNPPPGDGPGTGGSGFPGGEPGIIGRIRQRRERGAPAPTQLLVEYKCQWIDQDTGVVIADSWDSFPVPIEWGLGKIIHYVRQQMSNMVENKRISPTAARQILMDAGANIKMKCRRTGRFIEI